MKNINWKIVGTVAIFLLFAARIYMIFEKRKEHEKQQQMMEELSRMQSEQFRENYAKNMDSISKSLVNDLSEQTKALDSIGKKMKADQEAFEKKMKE